MQNENNIILNEHVCLFARGIKEPWKQANCFPKLISTIRRDGGWLWEAWTPKGLLHSCHSYLILALEKRPFSVCFRLDSATGVRCPPAGTVIYSWKRRFQAHSLSQSSSWEDWIVFSQVHIGLMPCLFFTYPKILYFSSFKGICISRKFKMYLVRYCLFSSNELG